jgi:O-antigen/teichoic acid export membrane protein
VFLVQVLFGEALLATFGRGFAQGQLALTVLAVGQLGNYASGAAVNVLTMTGRSRTNLLFTIAHLVLTVALNLLLIPPFGLVGAAVANAAAMTAVNAGLTTQVWRLTGMHPYDQGWLKPVGAGLGAAAVTVVARALLSEGAAGELAGMVVLGVTYLGLLALLGFEEDDRAVLGQLVKRVRRRPAADTALAATAAAPGGDQG